MDKSTALGVLREQLEKLNEFKPGGKIFSLNYKKDLNYFPTKNLGKILRKKYYQSASFIAWEIGTIAILNNIFGPTHDLVRRFKSIEYDNYIEPKDNMKELDFANEFLKGVGKAENILTEMILTLQVSNRR